MLIGLGCVPYSLFDVHIYPHKNAIVQPLLPQICQREKDKTIQFSVVSPSPQNSCRVTSFDYE